MPEAFRIQGYRYQCDWKGLNYDLKEDLTRPQRNTPIKLLIPLRLRDLISPALPDAQAAQRSELQAASARKLHSSGPHTNGALTIRLDHLMGAAHVALCGPLREDEDLPLQRHRALLRPTCALLDTRTSRSPPYRAGTRFPMLPRSDVVLSTVTQLSPR